MHDTYSRRNFNDGDTIFSQGDRAGEAFVVQSGSVRLDILEGSQTREIDTISKGTIFGEMGVLSDMNRMASATAVGETKVLCCQRRELQRQLDELDEDKRDALRFLIVYSQNLLPFEMMENRPDDKEAKNRDKIAFHLVRDANIPGELSSLDTFMISFYRVLVSYAERRLPPYFAAENDL